MPSAGHSHVSPAQLLACLDLSSAIGKTFSRLYTYAQAHADIDTRDATFLGYQQEIGQIGADIGARTAFIEPEILRMGREAVEAFLAAEPGLAVYRHPLNDTLRRREHTGTETEEKIIAEAGLMAESSANIFTIFSNADFPFPDVTLHDGSRCTWTMRRSHCTGRLRTVRTGEKVFRGAFFNAACVPANVRRATLL